LLRLHQKGNNQRLLLKLLLMFCHQVNFFEMLALQQQSPREALPLLHVYKSWRLKLQQRSKVLQHLEINFMVSRMSWKCWRRRLRNQRKQGRSRQNKLKICRNMERKPMLFFIGCSPWTRTRSLLTLFLLSYWSWCMTSTWLGYVAVYLFWYMARTW
jgi:hypothetical protein